ncbi:Ca2+:H+ antiporter, partial [Tremellales sp. Uapishka_1]
MSAAAPSPHVQFHSTPTAPLSDSPPSSPGIVHTLSNTPGAGTNGVARRRPNNRVTLDDNVDSNGNARRPTIESTRSRGSEPNVGVLRRMTTGLFTPDKKIGKEPSYGSSFKAAAKSSYLNVLLIFIPIGWALYLAKHSGGVSSISDTAVFITTFIAIIPLAALLGFATEEAALRLGQMIGGLLNATLGNAVELIVAILALIKCELAVVQSSLVGSILSNILLVLGMCFFAGGTRFQEQHIKTTASQLNSSLLLIAVIAVLIPSAFHFSITTSADGSGLALTSAQEGTDLLAMSHGVAILLLLLYLGYLVFQMWTHATYYVDDEVSGSTAYPATVMEKIKMPHFHRKKHDEESATIGSEPTPTSTIPPHNIITGDGSPEGSSTATAPAPETGVVSHDDEDEQVPQMNVVSTIGLMVLDTVLVGVTAEFLVDSINGLVASNPSLSAEWVGLILLPIVGNAAEHFTAVSVSVKDKLDLSISVAVGSSIQIALFVIPVIELLAWCIGKPMTLLFDPYESVVLFLSVLIVNQTLADGRSNWMEGLVLMFLYLIIAVSFWYYPGSNTATLVGC